MAVISVALEGRPYEVHVGTGLLDKAGVIATPFLRKKVIPVVADVNARRLHGDRLAGSLMKAGHEIAWFEVPSGEPSKSWDNLRKLTDWMLSLGVERGDHVLAFGGGVVGDLTGFASAILKRGCGFIQLPTTLLAQVDSSVGGKTAINSAAGKNLIGAFHQPSLVLADISCLETLPPRELRAGYAEVLKYGVLGDAQFFDWLDEHGDAVLRLDVQAAQQAVAHSVAAKAAIVARDEKETAGARALLNLGHTFGHALEAETGFSDRLLHGEAVALGMVLAARYSARRGFLPNEAAHRLTRTTDKAGLPAEVSALGLTCDGEGLVEHMLHDKKMDGGTLPFILLRDIGNAFVTKDVELSDVARFLDEQLQAH
ncbi:3-dehydroquinate synthase [Altererythrobacter sp. SALINAS58]|uniref:3-dehydroquinate synthase n=1 Tax=Alteripontixanthobacter muriae TaxID=2705546 RepID=UPI001576339A|nr:3-dehydroquinate synthase [Alteripontixanthobacter muriae]